MLNEMIPQSFSLDYKHEMTEYFNEKMRCQKKEIES